MLKPIGANEIAASRLSISSLWRKLECGHQNYLNEQRNALRTYIKSYESMTGPTERENMSKKKNVYRTYILYTYVHNIKRICHGYVKYSLIPIPRSRPMCALFRASEDGPNLECWHWNWFCVAHNADVARAIENKIRSRGQFELIATTFGVCDISLVPAEEGTPKWNIEVTSSWHVRHLEWKWNKEMRNGDWGTGHTSLLQYIYMWFLQQRLCRVQISRQLVYADAAVKHQQCLTSWLGLSPQTLIIAQHSVHT